MCGIGGIMTRTGRLRGDAPALLERMAEAMRHRGPDDGSIWVGPGVGFAFRRLSINDLAASADPFTSEDGSITSICNGEIFNWRELREDLIRRGHRFRTEVDTEIIPHLYEEHGEDAFALLNGQFAVAVHDGRSEQLVLARDQLGILPLHYAVLNSDIVFGSEAKTVLAHEGVPREIDLLGVDQAMTFPGIVSPRTAFLRVRAVRPGGLVRCRRGVVDERTYWDLEYPLEEDLGPVPDDDQPLVDDLSARFDAAVRRRTLADVRVGCYLSGGLDSSLITAVAAGAMPTRTETMSVAFSGADLDESEFQREMVTRTRGRHHERLVTESDILDGLTAMVRSAEVPVKESYNVCSVLLAETARQSGHVVVLTGEGSDELFGGYPGYRMDALGGVRQRLGAAAEQAELELREQLFGDADVGYERNYVMWRNFRRDLYAEHLREHVDHVPEPLVDGTRLRGRHRLHQRSYLDLKLRMADHLLGDHGDRMAMSRSVEARYPFLDREVVDFATRLHPGLMVGPLGEKHMVKRIAQGLVPERILRREKYGFRAPSSPALLRTGGELIGDLLSPERIRRQAVFDPDVVSALQAAATEPDAQLHPHTSDDLLMIVLTTGLLMDEFGATPPSTS